MKAFIIGSSLVIIGGLSVYAMAAFGVPKPWSAAIGIAICAIGFIVQMCSLFGTKRAHDRHMRNARMMHGRIMAEASSLPPEQAIDLLLKRIRK